MIKNKTKVLECLNFGTYILFPDLQISLDPETAKKNGKKSKFMKLLRFTRPSQIIWEVEGQQSQVTLSVTCIRTVMDID